MVSPVAAVADALSARDLRLLKTVPRGPDRLLLELRGRDGLLLAGQWHRDPAESARLAERTRRTCGPRAVSVLDDSGIVLQHAGADHRLPALHELTTLPGAALVAHRAGRRGVVRSADGSYVKVLRPPRAAQLADALTRARLPLLATPDVVRADAALGTVRTTALPGRTVHAVLADPAVPETDVAQMLRAVGEAVQSLHQQTAASTAPRHDMAAEIAVTRRWWDAATEHGLLAQWRHRADGELVRAQRLTASYPRLHFLLHRDLHDKQLLVDPGRPVGLLDLDLLAGGDPALDLANLLAHLELRRLQGMISPARLVVAREALLAGYGPTPDLLRRLPGYGLCARLRLAAVYAFRAGGERLAAHLIDPVTDKEQSA